MKSPETVTIKQIEKAIDIPVLLWAGNCCPVAIRVVREGVVKGRMAYGHFRGRIAKTGTFANRADIGFTHHAWVWLEDGRVFDPTRWAFEDVEPYLHIGNKHEGGVLVYDEGGTVVALEIHREKPRGSKGQRFRTTGLQSIDWCVAAQMGRATMPAMLSIQWVFWLANQPPAMFMGDDNANIFYAWLQKRRLLAAVPIDFRRMTGFEQCE